MNFIRRPLKGRYYYRTGSTKIELTGASLNEFLLKKSGLTWDASIETRATHADLDSKSIQQFLTDAETANRLLDAKGLPIPDLLDKLRLRTGNQLTCAAFILFGKDPARLYPGLSVRIGRFGSSDTDLRYQEVVEGNVFYCLKETLSLLASKFLIKPVRFEGILRIEDDQYPLPALREALLNALVHRRYQSGIHVQIRVYDHQLIIWNDGPLPEELPVAALLKQHSSRPRNPLIADICFKAGYIDSWGRGIEKITEACRKAKLPDPLFEEANDGMRVTLTSRISEAGNATTPEVTEEVTAPVGEYARRPHERGPRESVTPESQIVETASPQLIHRLSFSNLAEIILLSDETQLSPQKESSSDSDAYRDLLGDLTPATIREPMQNNTSVRHRLGQRGIKPETLPPLLSSSFSGFSSQRGQLFSSTQMPPGVEVKRGPLESSINSRLFAGDAELSLAA